MKTRPLTILALAGLVCSLTPPAQAALGNWTARSSGVTLNLNAVHYGVSQFIAVGDGVILTSANGTIWTERPYGAPSPLLAVTYANGQYVTVGIPVASAEAAILTSPNAGNWTAQSSGTFDYLFGVSANSTQYVAVGGFLQFANSTVLTSPDGVTWSTQSASPQVNLVGITSNDTLFVAVGSFGQFGAVTTSPDGVTWTSQYAGLIDALAAVTWGNDEFVAVGDAGTIITSPDGVTWSSQNSGTTDNLNAIVWTGKSYVAVGNGGLALVSPDGMHWTASPTGSTANLLGVCVDDGVVVAVGQGGVILSAPEGTAPLITTQPVGATVVVGRSVKFTVGVAGTSPFTYQWYLNKSAITGATKASYNISRVSVADAGNYKVVVTGPAGTATSKAAALAVLNGGTAPGLVAQPKAVTVKTGATATLAAKANGTAPLSYQWQFKNKNLANGGNVSGATIPNLKITHAVRANAGSYRIIVTNPIGTATSSAAKLTVK